MKRVVSLFLASVIALTPVLALAMDWQWFFSSMSNSELMELQEELEKELSDRGLSLSSTTKTASSTKSQVTVWIPRTGSKYHKKSTCSNMKNPREVSVSEAKSLGYTPCKKCNPPK